MNVIVKNNPALVAITCVAILVVGGLVAVGKLDGKDLLLFVTGLGLPSLLGHDDSAKDGAK